MRLRLLAGILVMALGGACGESPPPSEPTETGSLLDEAPGGDEALVQGTVSIGPLCPVERYPPEPVCSPGPELFATVKLLVRIPQGPLVATVGLDETGGFAVELAPGSYVIDSNYPRPGGGGAWPPEGGGGGGSAPGDSGQGACCDPIPEEPPAGGGFDPPFPTDTVLPPVPFPDSGVVEPDSGWIVPEPPPGWPSPGEPPQSEPPGGAGSQPGWPDSIPWEPTEPPGSDPSWPDPPVDPTPPGTLPETRVALPVRIELAPGEVRRLDIDIDTGIR